MPTVDEIYTLIKRLEEKLDNLTIHSSQVQAGDLSSIVDNLGLQRAGEVRYGRGTPGVDFSGLRLSSGGLELYDSDYDLLFDLPAATSDMQDWVDIGSFADSWANYDTSQYDGVGYRKDPTGIVHLRGVAKSGTPAGDSTGEIFVLPAGYRPALAHVFATVSNNAIARLDILTTGGVRAITGTSDYFSLDGISFPAST